MKRQEIIELLSSFPSMASYGFTHVDMNMAWKELKITHGGNMGNGIEHVSRNLNMLGLPSVDELKAFFPIIEEDGSPDYMYILKLRID